MKTCQLTVLLLFCFLSNSFFTQSTALTPLQDSVSPKKKVFYEMGMNIYALTMRGGDFYTKYDVVLDNQIFSGIYFKLFKGKNSLRTSLNYSNRNVYNSVPPFSHSRGALGQLKSIEINLGYQRMFGKKKLAPYFYSDLEYIHFWQLGQIQPAFYPTPYYSSYSYDYYRYYSLTGSFYCLSPGMGLRWRIGNHLVLNFETGAQFFYSKEFDFYGSRLVNNVGINAKPLKFSLGFTY